jgi:hypothetical protein
LAKTATFEVHFKGGSVATFKASDLTLTYEGERISKIKWVGEPMWFDVTQIACVIERGRGLREDR